MTGLWEMQFLMIRLTLGYDLTGIPQAGLSCACCACCASCREQAWATRIIQQPAAIATLMFLGRWKNLPLMSKLQLWCSVRNICHTCLEICFEIWGSCTGGTQKNGWFLLGKIPSINRWTGVFPFWETPISIMPCTTARILEPHPVAPAATCHGWPAAGFTAARLHGSTIHSFRCPKSKSPKNLHDDIPSVGKLLMFDHLICLSPMKNKPKSPRIIPPLPKLQDSRVWSTESPPRWFQHLCDSILQLLKAASSKRHWRFQVAQKCQKMWLMLSNLPCWEKDLEGGLHVSHLLLQHLRLAGVEFGSMVASPSIGENIQFPGLWGMRLPELIHGSFSPETYVASR